jgi:ATP-dependent RNA helicase DHX8/PRP22
MCCGRPCSDCSSASTRIRFLTDGCLLREVGVHKHLEPYSVIILDEAHERSLQTDLLFGLIRRICRQRSSVKFIITSATLDASKFSRFFFNCPTMHVPGRCFPIDIIYSQKTETKYVEKAVDCVLRIHSQLPLGDVLVFLTGTGHVLLSLRCVGGRVSLGVSLVGRARMSRPRTCISNRVSYVFLVAC